MVSAMFEKGDKKPTQMYKLWIKSIKTWEAKTTDTTRLFRKYVYIYFIDSFPYKIPFLLQLLSETSAFYIDLTKS